MRQPDVVPPRKPQVFRRARDIQRSNEFAGFQEIDSRSIPALCACSLYSSNLAALLLNQL